MEQGILLTALAREATQTVREAGELARAEFAHPGQGVAKSQGDVVTPADRRINRFIIERLERATPEFAIVSEESPPRKGEGGYAWILDPIDGSKHYNQSIPLYGISLALHREGSPLLGVVYAPSHDDMFCGIPGTGAWRNDKPIRRAEPPDLMEALVCAELPSRHHADRISGALKRFEALVRNCQRVRTLGVTSLGMCYCAAGGFAAYVNLGSAPNALWDRAAGEAVLLAAGCQMVRRPAFAAAAHERLLPQLVRILDAAGE